MTAHAPRWRWHRPDKDDPLIMYAAEVPGPLGVDGVAVELTRSATVRANCPICGKRSLLWHATLALPPPWGRAGFFHGCSRAHATEHVPLTWQTVAEGFLLAAEAITREGRNSDWHLDRIALHRRQAEHAAWLHDQPSAVRRLALQMWAHNDLTIPGTEILVAAVLAAPSD